MEDEHLDDHVGLEHDLVDALNRHEPQVLGGRGGAQGVQAQDLEERGDDARVELWARSPAQLADGLPL